VNANIKEEFRLSKSKKTLENHQMQLGGRKFLNKNGKNILSGRKKK